MRTPPANIESRLAGLLALLLALCVNPATTAYLLTADNRLDSRSLFYGTWVLTMLLALLSTRTLFRGDRLPRAWSRALLVAFSAALTLYLTIFADRLVGRLLLPPAQSLIFPPNSAVRYQTPEFDITARINHLGFRDREYPVEKGKRFRILVIGDSFTFGWGVALADTWVKQLERKLQAADPAVEVLNLGRSGASPETYADIAARAVPVLQPDLVLVAVLQGNDLYQSIAEPGPSPGAPGLSRQRLLRVALANAYPNFLRLLQQAALQSEVKPIWQQQAQAIAQSLSPDQRQRLQQLDPSVQQYFRTGNLNPDLVLDNIRNPDLYLNLEQVHHPELQKGIRRMSFYLARTRELASNHGAATWLVAVPNKFYLCEKTMQEHRKLGLRLDTTLLHRNAPDSILAAEATRLHLPLVQPESLKKHCRDKKLYYTYDGHFTPVGNQLFAEAVFAAIQQPLQALRSRKKTEKHD
jgi:lysophospholipase L1-like esterase